MDIKKKILKSGILDDQKLKRAVFYELSFVIKKFLKLPKEEKREVYTKINSDDIKIRTEALHVLVGLILDNSKELAEFVSPALDCWIFVDDNGEKKAYILAYFLINLNKNLTIKMLT